MKTRVLWELLFAWCDLGSPLLGKGDSPWLVWVLCWQEVKKSLEADSFMPFLGGVEGKKQNSVRQ